MRRNKPAFESEAELAKPIVAWFSEQGFEVYQEVELSTGGNRADIVAVCGKKIVVVETKLTLGLKVIEQAWRWTRQAHLVYCGVPIGAGGRDNWFALKVATDYGLGVLQVSVRDDYWSVKLPTDQPVKRYEVSEKKPATFQHQELYDVKRFLDSLGEGHKTFAEAGNNSGRRWTPFQQTCMNLTEYVKNNPGATIKETIDAVKHHYSSTATARACMMKYITSGVVKDIRVDTSGKAWKLYWKGADEKHN